MKIRMATPDDAQPMLDIYSPFILNSGITQEIEIPTIEEFKKRIGSYLETYPWLVCEANGKIEGYAYASQHRGRKGYQWCVETSVYINENSSGKGFGKALYKYLFEILKLQGFVNAYAVITLPNIRSVEFHRHFGFTYQTTFKKIGFKLDQWHDVDWWHYQVNAPADNHPDPVPMSRLDKAVVNRVFDQ